MRCCYVRVSIISQIVLFAFVVHTVVSTAGALQSSRRNNGCCEIFAHENVDSNRSVSLWLNCIRGTDDSIRKLTTNIKVPCIDLKSAAKFLGLGALDRWRLSRCCIALPESAILSVHDESNSVDSDQISSDLSPDDLLRHRLQGASSKIIIGNFGPSLDKSCQHHHLLYDIRTILGPRHITYTEIQSRRGISASLMLEHPYETSLMCIGWDEIANTTIQEDQVYSIWGKKIEVIYKNSADCEVLRELHEQEFQTDILFLDGNQSMACVAKDFYNYQEFVRPGGFVIFDDYSEDESALHVPAFVDELVSKTVNHGWSYYDAWGAFPTKDDDPTSRRLFVFYRRAESLPSPFVSNFSIKFEGKFWDKQMGLSRARFPPTTQATNGDNIHFAVLISFFWRDFDPLFIIPQTLSLTSLARQTYRHWTLIAVGDGIPAAAVAQLHEAIRRAGIPQDRVIFRNMDARFREETIYRNRDSKFDWEYPRRAAAGSSAAAVLAAAAEAPPVLGIWKCAGTNALNVGLDMAEDATAATHVARIDEDDVWTDLHLEHLAEAYRWAVPYIGRTADFAYTQGRDIGGQSFFPSFNRSSAPEFAPPFACNVIHAATSWDHRRLGLRYRLLGEQMAFPTSNCGTCDYDCGSRWAAGQAVDADMWARVEELIDRGRAAAVFYPVCDVRYTNESKKARIKALLAAAADPDEARARMLELA